MEIETEVFRVKPCATIDLAKVPTSVEPVYTSKKRYKKLLKRRVQKVSSMQRLHYASNQYALLLIFQGMDAAGKDGAIRHVMSGVNPAGRQVFSLKSVRRRGVQAGPQRRRASLRCMPAVRATRRPVTVGSGSGPRRTSRRRLSLAGIW
jgi:hypothetical protein